MSPLKQKNLIAALIILLLGIAIFFVEVPEQSIVQPTYTTNAREVVGGVLVGQTFVARADNLAGVAIQFATYSGRDNTEPVEFYLREAGSTTNLRRVTIDPRQLGDNQMYRVLFTAVPESAGKTYFFFVTSPTSRAGNAITVDLDDRNPYFEGTAYVARALTDTADEVALATAGKPGLDVTFATFHDVPLPLAAGRSLQRAVHTFRVTWDERRSEYANWLQAIAFIAVFVVLAFVLQRYPNVLQSKKYVRFILSGLCVAAIVARLVYATSLPATTDEGNYLYDAAALRWGVLAGGDGYVKAPLVILWISMWQLVFGNTVLAGRLSSIVASAALVLPLFVLGRVMWNKKAGVLAAAAWALFGAAIVSTIYVHTQPLALLFGVSGVAAVLVALRGSRSQLKRLGVAGVLLGLGVVSRKSIVALGLVPLVVILLEGVAWRKRVTYLVVVGAGFLVVVGLFLGLAVAVYGQAGVWELLGVSSAEDGLNSVEPSQLEQVRAYSLRGMTPFFRESLPLIWLAVIGCGILGERAGRAIVTPRWQRAGALLGWIVPVSALWWAWSFFAEYEGSVFMHWGVPTLWLLFFVATVVVGLWRAFSVNTTKASADWRLSMAYALLGILWIAGLAFFYSNWLKFHANYIGEFLPPLALLTGIGTAGLLATLLKLPRAWLRWAALGFCGAVVMWSGTISNYITYTHPHTGTFELKALDEARVWAQENIPLSEPIFTGAALVPYLSGHHVSLDIAHPRWYAYEFTRKDPARLNTFLPPAEKMVQAFRDAEWFLLEGQTGFSFLMEYSEIEAGLEKDFEEVKGISNGSNTLVFYKRVRN